jgi:ribosomal protein L10
MGNYTSSLPDDTLVKLNDLALTLKVPKNRIIERALEKYMKEIDRQLYIKSFKMLKGDKDLFDLAEEGMGEYKNILNEWDKKK